MPHLFTIRDFIHFPPTVLILCPFHFDCFDSFDISFTIIQELLHKSKSSESMLNGPTLSNVHSLQTKFQYLAQCAELTWIATKLQCNFFVAIIDLEHTRELWPRIVIPAFLWWFRQYLKCSYCFGTLKIKSYDYCNFNKKQMFLSFQN